MSSWRLLYDAIVSLDLNLWGSCASILSLLIATYAAVRISNVARWVAQDRRMAQNIQNPIDIYFSIRKAEALLETYQNRHWSMRGEEDSEQITYALRGLRSAATFLGSYFYFVDGPHNLEANVFLAGARYYRLRRDPERAIDYYQKALDHDHGDHGCLKPSERKECLSGMLSCHLLCGDLQGARRVLEVAKENRVKLRSRRREMLLLQYCGERSLDAIDRVLAFFHRRKPTGKGPNSF